MKKIEEYGFGHVPLQVIKLRCIYLHDLEPSKRCEFVRKSHCDDDSELFMYHHYMFCDLTSEPSFDNTFIILYICGMAFWLYILFMILATTVDEYFCPAIGNLSKLLHLSENLAGVTLLALGNGTPDILSGITSATKGDTILMFNQLLGSGMFVSCVVAGCVVVSRPFYILPFYFLRDVGFTLIAIVWVQITTVDRMVTLWESITYIALYVFYLIVVIGGFFIQERFSKYFTVDKQNDVDWGELRKRTDDDSEDEDEASFWAEEKEQEESPMEEDTEPPTKKKLFRDLLISLNPIKHEEWVEMNVCLKIMACIRSPFLLLLNLMVPVVSAGTKRYGWSKLLNCFHLVIFPSFFVFAAKLHHMTIYDKTIFLYVSPMGPLFAFIVFLTSSQNKPPIYHDIFSFLSFLMGISIIFTVVKEVVGVLNLFGTMLKITPQMLGISVLAWGNSLGDAVANVQIARQGFQRMAFAASFAGVLANTLLTLGITFLIKNLQTPVKNHARSGIMGPNLKVFFLISLTFSLLYVLLTKFQCRRSYGIFLFLIYGQFFFFCVLCEVEVIHPLGHDHEFSFSMFKVASNRGQTSKELVTFTTTPTEALSSNDE